MHKAPSASAALTLERPAAPAVPVALVARLETTRRGLLRLRRVRTLLRTAVALLLLAGLLALADWVWVLGTDVRAAGLVALAALAVAGALRVLLAGRGGPRHGDVAVEVEGAFPALGQSVRTTVEYVEPAADTAPATPGLVRALTQDTDRRTRELPLQKLIPWRSLWLPAACLAFIVLAFAALLAWNPELRTTALRLALRPAQYTNLEVAPGDSALKLGKDFTVQATVSGRPVSNVDLFYRQQGAASEWKSVAMAPPEALGKVHGQLDTTLRDCREDLEYRVVAGPVESPVYRLAILRPLVLKKVEAAVEPPAYTRKPAAVVPEGNLTVLQGSRVRFQFTLDRPPAEAFLSVRPGDASPKSPEARPSTLPLRVEGTGLTGELAALEKDVVYEVHARAADGMELEPARFRIQVQPDRKPSVQFLHPREQLEVTPTTEVRLKVQAADDLGLGKVGIVYQVGSGPAKTLYLNESPGQPASHDAEAVLALEEHALGFQDAITYYAFAEDNRPGRPQRATTELQFIDIRPFKREYQFVKGGGGCCNGASVTLEELIARQRVNLQRTFRQSGQTPADPEAVRRLGKTERELAGATEEFTAGMEQRAGGPIPALHEALEAMETAAAALERTELEPGRESEEAALAGLIKARKNLRQILKDSQCASACQKFDAQQKQKLRKPPEKDKKEMAKLREAVEQLAKEEKKLSEEITPKSGGAQLEKKDSGKPHAGKPSPSSGSPSPGEGGKASESSPLERQQKAAQTAKDLQQQVANEEALKGLPRERMDAAARAIEESARDLEGKRDAEAGKQAAQAAKELERLARQVEALQAAELAARLAAAQSLAKQVAGGQEQLTKEVKEGKQAGGAPRPAERQKDLAEEADTLADLLKKIQEQAEDKNPQLGKALRQVREAHPPEEAVGHMRRAAEALHEGRPHEGGREAEQAARLAGALARAVEAARRGFLQPQLDQLLAAEKKAAEAHKALHSADSDAKKAEAGKKLAELHDALDKLPAQDKKIDEAAAALARVLQHEVFWDRTTDGKPHGGAYIPPYEYVDTVQRVARVLQAKIQEVILKDALLDKDEPVPPQFKALVEEYYRILSEDLR
jgi:hypothetical protein